MSENHRGRTTLARKSFVKAESDRKSRAAAADIPYKQIDFSDLSDHLGFLVRRAQLWVFKDVTRSLALFDIRPAQYSVLTIVNANPGINQLAVADALAIERAGLGRLVERLEKRNFLKRIPSTVDRRSYLLHLTPEGRKMLARMKAIVYEHDKHLAKKLGPGRYEELLRILTVFLDEDD